LLKKSAKLKRKRKEQKEYEADFTGLQSSSLVKRDDRDPGKATVVYHDTEEMKEE
jgi:hypothetical protein